jgi:hypothetical protein
LANCNAKLLTFRHQRMYIFAYSARFSATIDIFRQSLGFRLRESQESDLSLMNLIDDSQLSLGPILCDCFPHVGYQKRDTEEAGERESKYPTPSVVRFQISRRNRSRVLLSIPFRRRDRVPGVKQNSRRGFALHWSHGFRLWPFLTTPRKRSSSSRPIFGERNLRWPQVRHRVGSVVGFSLSSESRYAVPSPPLLLYVGQH